MIDYEYTSINRMEHPHKYMYTPYQGEKFIDSYFKDRLKYFKNYARKSKQNYKYRIEFPLLSKATIFLKDFLGTELSDKFDKSLNELIDWKNCHAIGDYLENTPPNVVNLSSVDIKDIIKTEDLLCAILNTQLKKRSNKIVKFWLDILVKKFEVTKKIYENYGPNFSKGEGKDNIIFLYCVFALCLSLFYCTTKNIKYLSTLLKVNDLICSLDEKILNQNFPLVLFAPVILVEILSIKSLSQTIKEVNFDTA
ncbi:hypothetical protein ABXT54_07095 [Methylophilaceae bacterium Uisw_099_01]